MRQIDLNEALRLAAKGQEIKVLAPAAPWADWNDYVPDTLPGMLDGCLFFRDEPALVDPGFEAAVRDMEAQSPSEVAARGTKKPAGKRRPVDTGKIMALHNAGWSNVKIAEELGMNEKTVWYYVSKARKEEQDGKDN